jgi:hypothetical protein
MNDLFSVQYGAGRVAVCCFKKIHVSCCVNKVPVALRDPKNEGTRIQRNTGSHLPICTLYQSRSLQLAAIPLWSPYMWLFLILVLLEIQADFHTAHNNTFIDVCAWTFVAVGSAKCAKLKTCLCRNSVLSIRL